MFLKVVLDVMLLLVSAWMKVRYSGEKFANQFKHTLRCTEAPPLTVQKGFSKAATYLHKHPHCQSRDSNSAIYTAGAFKAWDTCIHSNRLRTWGCPATALFPVLASLPASASKPRWWLPTAGNRRTAESARSNGRR
jgi:hypothetical protein